MTSLEVARTSKSENSGSFLRRFSKRMSFSVAEAAAINLHKGEIVEVLEPYAATDDVELSLPTGTTIRFLEQDENGWARGEINGREGWFPVLAISPRRAPPSPPVASLVAPVQLIRESSSSPPPTPPPPIPTSRKQNLLVACPAPFVLGKDVQPKVTKTEILNSDNLTPVAGVSISGARADSIMTHRRRTAEKLERWLATNQRPSREQLAERNILPRENEEDKKNEKRKRSSLLLKLLGNRGKKSHFGVGLGELPLDDTEKIPKIVVHLSSYLRKNAFHLEGVFRISGATREVLEMRKKVDKEYENGLDLTDYTKPHTIATLFKQFFSQLPEPIFTFELYTEFIQCLNDDPKVTVASTRILLNKIPQINFRTAQFLFRFLSDVSGNSSQNKMSPSNLALIFAPNILRPQNQTNTSVFETKNCRIVEIIIENYGDVFGNQWKNCK